MLKYEKICLEFSREMRQILGLLSYDDDDSVKGKISRTIMQINGFQMANNPAVILLMAPLMGIFFTIGFIKVYNAALPY